MSAAVREPQRGRTPPPARGKPFYDADSGRTMIVPRGGGKAIPYIAPSKAPSFSARGALRRAGVRSGSRAVRAGDRAAARAQRELVSFGRDLAPTGAGSLAIWALGTIFALILLERVLSDQGPRGIQTILGSFGTGLTKLVNPADPLVPRAGTADAATSTPAAPAPAVFTARSQLPGRVRVQGPVEGLDKDFATKLLAAAAAAGATMIEITSGRRDPAHNAQVRGVPNSNHITGHAVDGYAHVPGTGRVPLGLLPTLERFGLRSGNQPGFYNGRPDPIHVDDAYNLRGGSR